jgi:serine/threonine-protein kinase
VAIGTPHYMSPEQAAGDREIDGRSDLYSLGVVTYQMLAGELPFKAETVPGILMKQITEAAPYIGDRVPGVPDDLSGSVMRCLEKEPENRWPTADALRRALESRTAPAYRPRRSTPASRRSLAPPLPPLPGTVPRSPRIPTRGRPVKPGQKPAAPTTGEPAVVTNVRRRLVNWAGIGGGLVLLDLVMGHGFGFLSVIAVGWGGFSLLPAYLKMWHEGYSWRDVLYRPIASDAAEVRLGLAGPGKPGQLLPPTTGEFGRQADKVQQVAGDYQAIMRVVERLPKSEQKLLPDIAPTANALLKRAQELARTLHSLSAGVEDGAVDRLDARLATLREMSESPERERQVGLLQRQRQALSDLLQRRQVIEDQLESCVLAMQTMRFDLLRLKSAGVDAVLGDLTMATQQARALSRDVDHAIEAASEIREALGGSPPSFPN